MSISGRRASRPICGSRKPKTVSKIRRTQLQAYTENWTQISERVKQRAGYRCESCGTTKGPFEADHKTPVARGGKTVMWNLWCLCQRCHDKRPGHKHLFKTRTLGRK